MRHASLWRSRSSRRLARRGLNLRRRRRPRPLRCEDEELLEREDGDECDEGEPEAEGEKEYAAADVRLLGEAEVDAEPEAA